MGRRVVGEKGWAWEGGKHFYQRGGLVCFCLLVTPLPLQAPASCIHSSILFLIILSHLASFIIGCQYYSCILSYPFVMHYDIIYGFRSCRPNPYTGLLAVWGVLGGDGRDVVPPTPLPRIAQCTRSICCMFTSLYKYMLFDIYVPSLPLIFYEG